MKYFIFLTALFIYLGAAASEAEQLIKHYELDNERVYELKVFFRNGVTTVMFPAEIEGIFAANATLNQIPSGSNPSFLIAYNSGSYYFSVRALREKASGYVNIIYGGKTYIIRLIENDASPYGSVSFKSPRSGSRGTSYAGTSVWLLKSLMDKAKAWDALKGKNGFTSSDVTVNDKEYISDYDDVKCCIRRIWRFNRYDVLVFYVVLKNESDKELFYNPRETAFSAGDKKCFTALADASGVLPPKSETIMFCAVTGSSDGNRKLAAENDWKTLLFASVEKQPGRS